MQFQQKAHYKIADLLEIMSVLRSPEGCPWDREQTHASIRKNMIEEAYEAAEAIDEDNDEMLVEELGDVLLQVVFHAQMAQEESRFDFDAVCDAVCQKLIVRHPHIFSDVVADTSEQVLTNWNKIKQQTKGNDTTGKELSSISKFLPALMRGQKIVKAAVNSDLLPGAEKSQDAAGQILTHLWEAVRLAQANKIDAEELFTASLNDFVKKQK